MADVSVRIEGDAAIVKMLNATGKQLEQAIRGAVADAALQVENRAKREAPVDTGRLRSSIGVNFDGDRLGADVGTNVEYAPHQEYGTVHQPGKPFLTPAIEEARGKFPATVEKHAKRVIG